MRALPGEGYRATRRYDPDATQILPKPPDTSQVSYRRVEVPENRSSVPGVGDKPDWGLRLLLALVALCFTINTLALLVVAWTLR